MNTVLVALMLGTGVIIVTLLAACWVRAHDGTMTGKVQLNEDIARDT